MIEYIVNNKEFFVIVVSLIVAITPLALFFLTKRKEQQQINFERFHDSLMNGLSNQGGKLGLDQQVAIIYELRNYPEYFPVIKRILISCAKRWEGEVKNKPHFEQLIQETKKTIDFMKKNWIHRQFLLVFKRKDL